MGITHVEVVAAEGLAIGPEQRDKAMNAALEVVSHLDAHTQLAA